ncbi:MAG: hypothetical protein HRT64_05940 [Erythrobacter sp.]|nr:hypothetical protein [Erythrobacter sp.]
MNDLLEVLLFVVPITTVIGGTVYLIRSKISGLQQQLAEERGSNRTAQIETEKSELEERVRVLERIVTDRGFDVATQIEALRDQPALSAPGATSTPLTIAEKEQA